MSSSDAAIIVKSLSKSFNGKMVLDDVNFTINKGENVGIIGPNGAGKSTLLKILSDVLKPDKGYAVLDGTVSSILEIGMGLHPDLTGTENVYFAGKLMGRSRNLISSKMDEIVAFSELRDHMDKAVKHYSSGMYLRLAFSIYTLLDSDILLLDEVLSVGDASFRKKSYNKMLDYKDTDKTVILVSHGLTEIESFCDRVIYLDCAVKGDSYNIRKAVLNYLTDNPNKPRVVDSTWVNLEPRPDRAHREFPANDHFLIEEVYIVNELSERCERFFSSDSINLKIQYQQFNEEDDIAFIWKLFDMSDNMLLATSPIFDRSYNKDTDNRNEEFLETTTFPPYFLNTGKFYLSLVCSVNRKTVQTFHALLNFTVEQDEWMTKENWSRIPAPILHSFRWKLESNRIKKNDA